MPYVVSHDVSLDGKAYSIGMPVPDAVGEQILAEHPNGCVRAPHDDGLCSMHPDPCAHESHEWSVVKIVAGKPTWSPMADAPAEA